MYSTMKDLFKVMCYMTSDGLTGRTKEANHMHTCYEGALLLPAALMQCLEIWLGPKADV